MVVVVAFLFRRRRTTTRVDAAVLRVWASEMFKNQLQELAQRSCFNLPAYACVREGPDHAPRFRASVNFNGEIFQGPSNCTTLRQAEHAAAEVALSNLSSRAPSRSIAARVLDETGVYKNLLQETTHRAGLKLPVYTTVRSGPGHQPVFTSTVELAGMCFGGEPAKTKKQAEKNAAMTAWSALKQMPDLESLSRPRDPGDGSLCCGAGGGEEQEQVVRVLSNFKPKEENKYSRQREHYHPQQQKHRRKLAVGYNEGSTSSASPHRSPWFQQPWRSLEPLSDLSLMNSSQQQQKKSTFLAPAVSTAPKVLPPLLYPLHSPVSSQEPFFHPSSRQIPALAGNSSSQSRLQEIQTLLGGKNGERVHEISTVQGKASSSSSVLAYLKPFAQPNTSVFAARPFSPPPYLKIPIGAASGRNSSAITVPRMMNTGGVHSAGIAPAVQIRSVIPVCAAPPPPQPPPKPSDCGGATSILKKEAEEEISEATSKLNKLQL